MLCLYLKLQKIKEGLEYGFVWNITNQGARNTWGLRILIVGDVIYFDQQEHFGNKRDLRENTVISKIC